MPIVVSYIKRKRKVPSRFSSYGSVSEPSIEPNTTASNSAKKARKELTLPVLSALLRNEVDLAVEFEFYGIDKGVTLLNYTDVNAMPAWVNENLTSHLCSCLAVTLSKMKERNYWYIEVFILIYLLSYYLRYVRTY